MATATATFSNRISGSTGMVMKRNLLLAVLLLWAGIAQAGDVWNNLWRTADQQGDQLMHQGKAAAAAHTYTDPRRKAYAELQAGDYQNAVKSFSAFNDSDGNYNRGNALAHAGQLQEALKAYDATLAHDPNNKDARHNRDLVAKVLQQQKTKSSSSKDSSSKDGKDDGKNQKDQSQQTDKDSTNKDNSGKDNSDKKDPANKDSGKQGDTSKKAAEQPSANQNQNGKNQQNKSGQDKAGDSNKQNDAQNQSPSAKANQTESSDKADGQPKPDDAAQARRDAAAALDKSQARKSPLANAQISEQQLAQEQWLRSIPDDPGGLLRRKFMIEHMIRHPGDQ